MAMTAETAERARTYAQTCRERGNLGVVVVGVHLALNGYEPHDQRYAEHYGHAVVGSYPEGEEFLVWWPDTTVREPHRALYVVDDGVTVVPMYVAGHRAQTVVEQVFLRTFPTDRVGLNGPVSFSTWMLSPRRAYHVKLTRNIPALAEFNEVAA